MVSPKTAPRKGAAHPARKPLPAALVKNAARSAASRQERLAAEARADIELIRARRERIVEDFYDIGEALERLKRRGVAESLGYKGFLELCEAELDMSPQKAAQLVAVVKAVPREQARTLGQERATALLALAEATPEEDSPVTLAGTTLKLPSGKKLDLAKASTREIRDAAKAVRQAKASSTPKRPRGATTTADERAAADALQAALRKHGVEEARVAAVARPGRGALLRIERVPVAAMALIGKAASEVTKSRTSTGSKKR